MSEQRFRAAFEDAPVGIAMTGVRGDECGPLPAGQPRAVRAVRPDGRGAHVPAGRSLHPSRGRLPDARLVRFRRRVRTSRTASRSGTCTPVGRVIWASVSSSVVRDDHGEPLHLITQIEDVSARRQADQALLDALESERAAAEQMRTLDETRTAVMSNAAHDLRTPLTSAAGFSELLLDGSAGELTDMQRRLVETISRGLARLGSIVDELVTTVAQADRGHARRPRTVRPRRRPGRRHPGHVDHVVHGRADADQRQPVARRRCRGRPRSVDRALGNLISNAVKFTPAGGTVRVEGSVHDDRAVITIADTGIGIARDEHEKIFDRYYRADGADGRVDQRHRVSGSRSSRRSWPSTTGRSRSRASRAGARRSR